MKRLLHCLPALGVVAFLVMPLSTVNAIQLSIPIVATGDDVEEFLEVDGANPLGHIDLTSSDLELGSDGPPAPRQVIGLRFLNIGIPQGATINSAFIQFMQDEPDNEADTDVRISGELAPNSAPFSATLFDVTSRSDTTNSVVWNDIPEWVNGSPATGECTVCLSGPEHRSPNIAPVVQEIVNQAGWTSGNALSIFIQPDPITDNTMERTAISYDDVVAAANAGRGYQPAILIVDYVPEPTALALVAMAGFGLAQVRRRRG
jgi:hypothetical protein